MFNLFKRKPNEQLVEIMQKCLNKVRILEQHKSLSSKGKYEALICCTFLELQTGPYSDDFKSKFLRHLINDRTNYGITTSSGQMVDFINSRIQFYSNEIKNNFEIQGYINGKIYNTIFENPLAEHPTQSQNLPEIINFSFYFGQLIKSFR